MVIDIGDSNGDRIRYTMVYRYTKVMERLGSAKNDAKSQWI